MTALFANEGNNFSKDGILRAANGIFVMIFQTTHFKERITKSFSLSNSCLFVAADIIYR